MSLRDSGGGLDITLGAGMGAALLQRQGSGMSRTLPSTPSFKKQPSLGRNSTGSSPYLAPPGESGLWEAALASTHQCHRAPDGGAPACIRTSPERHVCARP